MQTENKQIINPVILWFLVVLHKINKIILHPYFRIAMMVIGIALFVWWCPEISIFGTHIIAGARYYYCVNEPWFTDPNNMSHAVAMGLFIGASIVGGMSIFNKFWAFCSILLNLRLLYALYCDIFVETFNLFYTLVDFVSLTFVTYMMVLISQSIFNKSVSSTLEYRTSILAFFNKS
jgi:hypothetical protein